MTPDSIPAFLNGRQVDVAPGTTLADLLAQHDQELAAAVLADQARATDARGLPVMSDAVVTAGAIFRVFQSARPAGGATDA